MGSLAFMGNKVTVDSNTFELDDVVIMKNNKLFNLKGEEVALNKKEVELEILLKETSYNIATTQELLDRLAELSNNCFNVTFLFEEGNYSFDDTIEIANKGLNEKIRISFKAKKDSNVVFEYNVDNSFLFDIKNSFVEFDSIHFKGNNNFLIQGFRSDILLNNSTKQTKIENFRLGLIGYDNATIRANEIGYENTNVLIGLKNNGYGEINRIVSNGSYDTPKDYKAAIVAYEDSEIYANDIKIIGANIALSSKYRSKIVADNSDIQANNHLDASYNSFISSRRSTFTGTQDTDKMITCYYNSTIDAYNVTMNMKDIPDNVVPIKVAYNSYIKISSSKIEDANVDVFAELVHSNAEMASVCQSDDQVIELKNFSTVDGSSSGFILKDGEINTLTENGILIE